MVLLADLEARQRLIQVRVDSIGFAEGLGVDVAAELALVRAELEEHAAMVSALLELALEDSAAQKTRFALLPEDAEVKALAAVTGSRVEMYTALLGQTTPMMVDVELDTTEYDRQLLAVTGDLSTDVLDVGVLGGMLSDWSAAISSAVVDNAPTMLLRVGLFLLIVFVSLKAGKLVQSLLERALSTAQVQLSQLLHRMLLSGVRNLIVVLGFLFGLSQLGVSLGPVLAGLGIAGFVLGFALQDSLSNFASGLMILLYRPLDVGDLVEAGGVFGTVSHMSLVNTTILTVDNQTLIVPNNMIWTQVIKNVTKQRTRRVDMVFGISYGDDIPQAEGVLMEVLEKHEKVLSDPPPNVRVHELGDSSVNFVVRPWCETDDYWDVFWDVTKEVKMRFDAEGISIPFPQRDVHFYPTAVNEDVPKGALAEPLSRSAEVNEPPPASDADVDEGEGEQ
jgi:small conductance mechanosensitive channel